MGMRSVSMTPDTHGCQILVSSIPQLWQLLHDCSASIFQIVLNPQFEVVSGERCSSSEIKAHNGCKRHDLDEGDINSAQMDDEMGDARCESRLLKHQWTLQQWNLVGVQRTLQGE